MDFSIIIPTFNSAQYITACLEAMNTLQYDESRYEIIVVDGGSTDSTLDMISQFPKVHVVSSTNISISNSRNIGARKATGNALVFIDSDCLVDAELLNKAEKHLVDFECCGAFYKASGRQGWVARTWLAAEGKQTGLVNWITGGTLIVRKEFFTIVGGFNEALQTEEDEDFGHRVRLHGGSLMNDMAMASVHLGQADSLSSFFKKEVWRGMSLVKPVFGDNVGKYSVFDLAIIGYLLNFLSIFIFLLIGFPLFFWATVAICFSLPLLLVLRKMWQTGQWQYSLLMYVLYLVFLMARSYSLLRHNQFRVLFFRGIV